MNEFKSFHPIVNFTYFVFAIGFSMFFMHPVTLGISLITGFTYSVVLKGKKQIGKNFLYMLPMIFAMGLMNPLFNHQGMTILTYLPGGNPLTSESIYYGFISAVMIVSVICYFSCFNEIMTSDKLVYLFGRVIPALSLIFSMTLRLVPRFISQLKTVANAQKCVGRDMSKGGIISRAKNGLSILSIVVTWSLENSIETSDSMKSRGYGQPGRTAFAIYTFDKRDRNALAVILLLAAYVLAGSVLGQLEFSCFPMFKMADLSIYGISVFLAYFILCSMPVLIEAWEVRRWKSIESKI